MLKDSSIMAIGFTGEKRAERLSLSIIRAAANIAKKSDLEARVILIGPKSSELIEQVSKHVDEINLVSLPHFPLLGIQRYVAIIKKIVDLKPPGLVLAPHDAIGAETSANLAIEINAGYISNCSSINASDRGIIVTRQLYEDRIGCEILVEGNAIITFKKSFEVKLFDGEPKKNAILNNLEPPVADEETNELKLIEIEKTEDIGLDRAEIIVSGGMGLGSRENFKILYNLADVIGGVVGCSRPVADNGWESSARIVGTSGNIVSPKLYLACGISGQSQHMAGLINAGLIVAINTDRNAPIYKFADIGIAKNIFEVVPALTARLRALRQKEQIRT